MALDRNSFLIFFMVLSVCHCSDVFLNFGFSVIWLNGTTVVIDGHSIEATFWGSVVGKNGSGGWAHVDWAGATGSIVGINHGGFTGNQSNFGCIWANDSVVIGGSHRTAPTYVTQFDNVTVHCGDLGIDMHFDPTHVLTCRINSMEDKHRGQVLGGLTFGCVDGCCVPQSHYVWCYGNFTGNKTYLGNHSHCVDGCNEYVFVRNNSISTSAPDYCISKSVRYQELLLTGGGNFTNLTELCSWNCNGLNCADDFGCVCSGIPGAKCCQFSNNVTECRVLGDGNSFWLQHRVEIIVLLIMSGFFLFALLELLWCLCGYKNLKNKKWTITNGVKHVEVKGWLFIFLLWLCGFKPSRAVLIGPNDFGRMFSGPNDFGFKVNFVGFNSSGFSIDERCCDWQPITAGGISCCVEYPGDEDPCYTYKQDPTQWDCRSFTTGVAGWNDGCFCENDNTVTWCCKCGCKSRWNGFRFVFKQPFGSGVIFNGNNSVGFSFNNTGTIITRLANVTISGCLVPEPLDAWISNGHWLDARSCGKCVGGQCRPFYGSTHCSGRSNWGKVIATCECPSGGTPQPIGRNALLMSNQYGVRSVIWSYCDFRFDWAEQKFNLPNCTFWCGDWSNGWCNLHPVDSSCLSNGSAIYTPVWVYCGDDKRFNGTKCNGTIYVDPQPGPYNPDFPHDDPHNNGAGRFFNDLLKFWNLWHYYIVVFVCFVICWLIVRIVVCGRFNRR